MVTTYSSMYLIITGITLRGNCGGSSLDGKNNSDISPSIFLVPVKYN